MKVLGIESSGSAGNVCLAEDEAVLRERFLGEDHRHGRGLIPAIDALMNELGWKPEGLDLVAVSVGPGSFTGLRVGLAAAKVLALVGPAQLIGVPSLDVLVQGAPDSAKHACPVVDARRGEVYACLYRRSGGDWNREWTDRIASVAYLREHLPSGTCLLGHGLEVYAGEWEKRQDWAMADLAAWDARAAWVARLGFRRYRAGQRDDPHALMPQYLRLPAVLEREGFSPHPSSKGE
ncbi:MAG: tRNA (adenosine(37)-N6)-threonylcarbamoyltransferase complex dimerization subunit type 1 TsaB [Armatimonadetes bacterium]|nr:tRNA (adenosine(37)-N6)-threonylcarbamoyltransferase complex dimerization subunit type 1 TsaB [Armatimonadota bacterium]